MIEADMREFWDQRAREEPYFFIDDRRRYGDRELAEFWSDGARDLDQILDLVGQRVSPEAVALDIGCGVGRLTRPLAERAREVYGLDISSEMLELARRHNADLDNVHWRLGDGLSLSGIDDASIDVCISHVVFQHIPDPAITLGYVAEIGRVLRPGGWAAFQISNDPWVHQPRRRTPAVLLTRMRRGPRGRDHPAWLGSAVDLAQLRRVATEHGLELERVIGAGTQFCVVLARRTEA
jgi:SAM-dependent methyltransferase